MSKSGGGCSSGGGSGKSRSGGGKGPAITKSKEMKTTKAGADQIVYLRGAIYDEMGKDRRARTGYIYVIYTHTNYYSNTPTHFILLTTTQT